MQPITKKYSFFSVCLALLGMMSFNGCKTVSHMDELLLLKELSEEQKEMGEEVKLTDAHFDSLVKAVESGDILNYKDQDAIKETFGPPIFIESVVQKGATYKRWLYRYSVQFFDSKKVYLYFNAAGKLIKWESL